MTVICDEDRTDLSLATAVPVGSLLNVIERHCKTQDRELTAVDGHVLDLALSLTEQHIDDGGYLYLCESVARPPILRDRVGAESVPSQAPFLTRTELAWGLIGAGPLAVGVLLQLDQVLPRTRVCAVGVVVVLILMGRMPSILMRFSRNADIAVIGGRCRGVEIGLSLAVVTFNAGLVGTGNRLAETLGCMATVLVIAGARQFRDQSTRAGIIVAQLIAIAIAASFQPVGVLPIVAVIAIGMVMRCLNRSRSAMCRIVDRLEMCCMISIIPLMCGAVGLVELVMRAMW